MRIISGLCKGRKLYTAEGTHIRPTGDKVKGAVFSMIGEYLEDALVLDLFAGTGNLGLEALSRGARKSYFCDNSPMSIRLLKMNISMCSMTDKSEVFFCDFERALGRIKEKLDIIFLDPPYDKDLYLPSLELVRDSELLEQRGVIVTEYEKDSKMPEAVPGFDKLLERRYGRTHIALFGWR